MLLPGRAHATVRAQEDVSIWWLSCKVILLQKFGVGLQWYLPLTCVHVCIIQRGDIKGGLICNVMHLTIMFLRIDERNE